MSRRTSQRLILLYKVVEELVPAIKPEDYLTKNKQRRTRDARQKSITGDMEMYAVFLQSLGQYLRFLLS
jgi:hypothetical protein